MLGLERTNDGMERNGRSEMKVTDTSGTLYELIDQPNGKVLLENKRYKDISYSYSKGFIDSAIKNGVLTPIKDEKDE